jgi:hypothetical protein
MVFKNAKGWCFLSTATMLLWVVSIMQGRELKADLIFLDGNVKNEKTGPVNFDTDGDSNADIVLTQDGKMGIGTTSPKSTLEVRGSLGFIAQSVNSNVTLSENTLILADTTSGNVTLTLPSVLAANGRIYQIKKIADPNELIITASVNIDKASTITLTTSLNGYPFANIFSNGTQWYIRSKSQE